VHFTTIKHVERRLHNLLALTNQLEKRLQTLTTRNLHHPPTEFLSLTALAMASEFKLSATLRGHEEDVSILSCDFLISRSSWFYSYSMGFTAD
jgi:hypothetical protein